MPALDPLRAIFPENGVRRGLGKRGCNNEEGSQLRKSDLQGLRFCFPYEEQVEWELFTVGVASDNGQILSL